MKYFPRSTKVKNCYYDVYTRNEYGEPEVILVPQGEGDIARSGLGLETYEYTHGGHIFITAVDRAKELAEHLDSAPARSILELV